jgi:hypothetical protein
MQAHAYVEVFAARGVVLWREGESLRYKAPPGVLTPAVLAKLKKAKPKLLSILPDQADLSARRGDSEAGDRAKPPNASGCLSRTSASVAWSRHRTGRRAAVRPSLPPPLPGEELHADEAHPAEEKAADKILCLDGRAYDAKHWEIGGIFHRETQDWLQAASEASEAEFKPLAGMIYPIHPGARVEDIGAWLSKQYDFIDEIKQRIDGPWTETPMGSRIARELVAFARWFASDAAWKQ